MDFYDSTSIDQAVQPKALQEYLLRKTSAF